jgi:hypothetical protein
MMVVHQQLSNAQWGTYQYDNLSYHRTALHTEHNSQQTVNIMKAGATTYSCSVGGSKTSLSGKRPGFASLKASKVTPRLKQISLMR